jgi:hypothetical protein
VYFIPALIDRWKEERQQKDFIVYEKVDALRSFGGCRIEDDVVITGEGARVLGPGIPRSASEIETAMRAS